MSQLPVYENWNKAYRIQKYGNWYVNPPLHLFFFIIFRHFYCLQNMNMVLNVKKNYYSLKKIGGEKPNERNRRIFFFYFNNFISIWIGFFYTCMCLLKNIQIWIFVLGLFFSKMFMHAIGHFVHIYMSF